MYDVWVWQTPDEWGNGTQGPRWFKAATSVSENEADQIIFNSRMRNRSAYKEEVP